MKNKIILSITLLLVVCGYLIWPVYHALMYKDMVPMLIKPAISQPEDQPEQSLVFNRNFQQTADKAIAALQAQNKAIAAPGYTAAVAIDGKKVWAGSVGWSNIEKQVAMTPETQMRVGSSSKAITSVGLAQLVMQDILDLDAPISNYIKELPNKSWANITSRQLASHMAGIPHYGNNTELLGMLTTLKADEHFNDVVDALSLFDESDLLFKPGEKFEYSSLGTVILSAVMQGAAKQNYQSLMQQKVFSPLNMTSTTYESPKRELTKLASFYWRDQNQPDLYKPWMNVDLSHRLAGGGWISTSQDLVMLGQAFISDEFVNPDIRNEFWSVQKLNNGEENWQGYGIGWRIHKLDLGEGFNQLVYMHHGGVSAGAQSFLMVLPKYKMSVAINANIKTENFSDFNKVSYDLARLFIRDLEIQASF
jgi:serine beta-lactamase-like protein LACTB